MYGYHWISIRIQNLKLKMDLNQTRILFSNQSDHVTGRSKFTSWGFAGFNPNFGCPGNCRSEHYLLPSLSGFCCIQRTNTHLYNQLLDRHIELWHRIVVLDAYVMKKASY